MHRSIFLALAFALAATRSLADESPDRLSGDDVAVLEGVVHDLCMSDDIRRVAVSDEPEVRENRPELPDALLEREYGARLEARAAETTLWPRTPLCVNVPMVSGERIEELFAQDKRIPPGRDEYQKEFGVEAYVTVSRPAYSTNASRAVVTYGYHCGELCGRGEIIELVRTVNGWRVLRTFHAPRS